MPRKIRQLKADLRKVGFVEEKKRGKGSHGIWSHTSVPGFRLTLAGHDGADAREYQEIQVRKALSRVQQTDE